MLVNLVDTLALEILLWKLPMEQSFVDANVESGNNETIEFIWMTEQNVSANKKQTRIH